MNYSKQDLITLLEETEEQFSMDDKLDMDEKYLLQQSLWPEWYKEHVKSWVLLILNLHEKILSLKQQWALEEINNDTLEKVIYETESMYTQGQKILESGKFYSLNSFLKQWSPSNYLQEIINEVKKEDTK